MRFVLLFLLVIAIVLWFERYYWKRRAHFLELRVLGRDRSGEVKGLFDAWLDGRIEARLTKERNRK